MLLAILRCRSRAQGVGHIHEHGFDLEFENVLLKEVAPNRIIAKVSDFGYAHGERTHYIASLFPETICAFSKWCEDNSKRQTRPSTPSFRLKTAKKSRYTEDDAPCPGGSGDLSPREQRTTYPSQDVLALGAKIIIFYVLVRPRTEQHVSPGEHTMHGRSVD